MNLNVWRNFQICISVPLSAQLYDSYGSRTIAPEENPKTNPNLDPNSNPKRGEIFLRGQLPGYRFLSDLLDTELLIGYNENFVNTVIINLFY